MNKMSLGVASVAMLFVLMHTAFAAVEHPFQDFTPQPVSDDFLGDAGRPDAAWRDGMTFRSCEKRAAELTPAEHYILRGLQPYHGHAGHPEAWKTKVLMFAMAYKGQRGELPQSLDTDALRVVGGDGMVNKGGWFRSPITGQFPRLDTKEFTPGGVYLRALTPEEVQVQAQWDAQLAGLVTMRKVVDGGQKEDAVLLQPVIYYRFHGETGLLEEGISYLFAPLKKASSSTGN